MATVLAAVGSGDEVVVIEPCYDSYLPAIRLAGGTAVPVRARAHGRRSLLPHRLAARARRHHAQDAPADAELPAQPHRRRARRQRPGRAGSHRARHRRTAAVGRGLRTYRVRRQAHASVARRPLLAEHAFVISSFGKPITPPAGRSATAARRASSAPNCARCTSSWCSPCLRPCSTRWPNSCAIPSLPGLPAFYQTKRDRLSQGLENAFPPLPSPGTFFLLADYSDISKQAEADFARDLTVNHGVTVIPVSAFYRQPDAPESNHRIVRFCFAKKDATLDAALERLASV